MGAVLLLLVGGLMFAFSSGDGGEDGTETEGPVEDDGTVSGSDADEEFRGSNSADTFLTGGGDDFVRAGEGNDTIADFLLDEDEAPVPAKGNDTFYGGAGNDILLSSNGSDQLFGGTNEDELVALDPDASTAGADQLFGGYGEDTLIGDAGDSLTGGAGTDLFEVVIDDLEDGTVVEVTDFSPGEAVDIFVSENLAATLSETALLAVVDLGEDGAGVTLADAPVAVLSGVPASELQVIVYHLCLRPRLVLNRKLTARRKSGRELIFHRQVRAHPG